MERISRAISYLLHPLLMPTLGLLVLFYSGTYLSYLPAQMKRWILVFTFISTYLIPLGSVYFMYYQGIVKSLHLRSREERLPPLVISLVMYVFCYYLIRRMNLPDPYNAFLMGAVISIAVSLLVSTRYKLSIHMVGTGGLLALIGYIAFSMRVNLLFYLVVAALIAGIVGTARLVLKAHTPAEIYTGFFTGMVAVAGTMLLH